MATITAAQVKELRQATDAGMMECKKALVEAEGDFDAAVDILRKNGLAKAAKKAGRATNEGRVTAMVCKKDATKGAVVEINCETDFVAMNDKFANFCETMTSAVLHNDPADVEALKASEYEGQNVGEMLTEAIHTIGENMQVGNFKRIEIEGTGALVSYIHMNGKIGVLAGFNFCINFILGGGVMETTFIMNHAVGYHVMGGILCLLIMMLGTLTEEDSSKESSSNDKEVASK